MLFRRLHLAFAILFAIFFAALPLAAQVQKTADPWPEWETISPEAEEFTVLMPKNATTESTTFPFHKMELSARLYLAKSTAGPVVAVTSLSGIKSNPAAYSDFARFNSYIDAFKTYFPEKVRAKDTPIKLVLLSSRPFHGHTGRSYKATIGDLSGSVHAFATKKRFYAIVSLNTKKDDQLEEKFLSSFVLPERQVEQPKAVASGEQPLNPESTAQKPDQPPAQTEADPNQQPAENRQEPTNTPNAQNQGAKKGPIAGGMLNSKAIYLPTPEVPAGESSGVVLVAVIIDEQGSVIEAKPVSGPPHLHTAAVNAARLARFNPTLLMGEPVKVSGTLSYNFAKSN